MQLFFIQIMMLILLSLLGTSKGDPCATRCEWLTWNAWNSCTASCGGGTKTRMRFLCCASTYKDFPSCRTGCKLDHTPRHSTSDCNRKCYNGGSMGSSSCICAAGYYGVCCVHKVTCSTPTTLTNGGYSGSNFNYGGQIRYYCNSKYKLINGDATHGCNQRTSYSSTGYWNGRVPYCAYMASCESNPCENGSTCINGEDSYHCICTGGYTGKQCNFDIQPPVYGNCSENFTVHTAKRNVTVQWPIPQFFDPHGHNVDMSMNYPTNKAVMPWGDFVVQYVGTKLSNALQSECIFTVSVRPFPCKELKTPANGAFACNGWNSHMTEVCALFCESDYTTHPSTDIEAFFVCGASGKWSSKTDVACSENRLNNANDIHYYNSTCDNVGTKESIQRTYLQLLTDPNSDWAELCTELEWRDSCKPENVKLIC